MSHNLLIMRKIKCGLVIVPLLWQQCLDLGADFIVAFGGHVQGSALLNEHPHQAS